MSEQATKWLEHNDRYLAAMTAWIRLRLERLAAPPIEPVREKQSSHGCWLFRCGRASPEKKQLPPPPSSPTAEEIEVARRQMENLQGHDPPPALVLLAASLGLSVFDRNLVALCAAMELDTRIGALCARAQGDANRAYPTFGLAFALFDDPDWNSLSPHGPLRYWRLLEINQPGNQPLTGASLRLDERILNYLKGLNYLDDRLSPMLEPAEVQFPEGGLSESQQQHVDAMVEKVQQSGDEGPLPIMELFGRDPASKLMVAAQVASTLGLELYTTELDTLPSGIVDFTTFSLLWQREARLMGLGLYIAAGDADEARQALLHRFLRRVRGLIFVDRTGAAVEALGYYHFSVDINRPTPREQEQLWTEALRNEAALLPKRLAEQFSFNQNQIQRIARSALNSRRLEETASDFSLADVLWRACLAESRTAMDSLAQRIEVKSRWDQLILPSEQKTLLNQIIDQVGQRYQVYEEWGFRDHMNRGLGISALFSGESGTGKTMAAEVIANALQLDLYRIDLAGVVSKYIGETEKNLRRLFDAAEASGAILFFDEADALFGKRGEVRDSHDRYANIEINYLLQRMESYQGLAILATNMKSALDKAFVRRLRFIVEFPYPGFRERKQIWEKVFPVNTDIDDRVDFDQLAKFNLTGGNIFSIALNAAFLAAQQGTSITMSLLLEAVRTELKKLGRPVKESDFSRQDHIEVVK